MSQVEGLRIEGNRQGSKQLHWSHFRHRNTPLWHNEKKVLTVPTTVAKYRSPDGEASFGASHSGL